MLFRSVYLFEFINDQTKVSKCFIANDISSNKQSYNEFNITENSTEDLLSGIISLTENNFYKYNVYEQTSTTNLDVTLATNLIENGKVYCKGIDTVIQEFTDTQSEYVVYGG